MTPENRDDQGRLTRFVTKQGKGVLITRLWKEAPDGSRVYADHWTRRVVRHNRQIYFRLPENREEAEKLANEIDAFLQVRSNSIEQAIARFCPDKVPGAVAEEVATVGEVVTTYKASAAVLDVKASSAYQSANGLLRIVYLARAQRAGRRNFYGVAMNEADKKAVLAFPISDLTADFMSSFKSAMLAGVVDEQEKKSRKRSANSYLHGARSLFTEAARREYRAAGLNVPAVTALQHEAQFRKVDQKYRLPEVRVINAMFDLGAVLKKENTNEYLAWLLALHGGLRKEEIAHCRRAWFAETAPWRIRIQADGRFNPKGSEGETEVEPWVREELWRLGGEDYLLSGHETERGDDVFRRLNPRLRAAGMDRNKPVHELRKLFGSYIATTRGLFVAQKMLRHASAQLTSDDYADQMVDEVLRGRWKVG